MIGELTPERCADVVERVLDRIVTQQAHTVVLDITGIEGFDGDAATALNKLTSAVKMLGGQTLLTGAQAGVAQIAARGELTFDGVTLFRTMQDALKFCVERTPR